MPRHRAAATPEIHLPPAPKTGRAAPLARTGAVQPATTRRRPASPQGSADKRSAILAAALGLFSRYGLHGTTVDQVAAQARVSKSNLLYHFANKEELYVQALRDLLDDWLEPLRAFSAEQDPAAAVSTYIAAKIAFSRDRPDASRLFCLEMIQGAPLLRDELAGELRRLVDAKAEVVRVWIADGRLAPVDPHHLVFALWAVTQHYADFAIQVQAITGRTLDDPEFFSATVDNVQRILLRGILAPDTPSQPTLSRRRRR